MRLTVNGFQIGPLTISAFALIVVVALGACVAITAYRARRYGQKAIVALDLGTAMLFYALVLGRLFYIMSPPPSAAPYYTREWYMAHPLDLLAGPLAVWNGGFGAAGAILGVVLGAVLVLRARKADLWLWADIILPGALVAAMMLPWGNLLEGQMLGPATVLPWGVTVDAAGSPPGTLFHPTPAYVSIWTALIFATSIVVRRRVGKDWLPGRWSLTMWIAFLPGLFLADMLRVDVSRPLLGLSGVQIMVIFAEIILVELMRRLDRRP